MSSIESTPRFETHPSPPHNQNSMKSLKLGEVMDEPVSEDDAAYTDVDTNTSDDDVDNEEERESIGHGETQERYGCCREHCDGAKGGKAG